MSISLLNMEVTQVSNMYIQYLSSLFCNNAYKMNKSRPGHSLWYFFSIRSTEEVEHKMYISHFEILGERYEIKDPFTPAIKRFKHLNRHFEEDGGWLWKGTFVKYV